MSFVKSVLSTKKLRQSFYRIRNFISIVCGIAAMSLAHERFGPDGANMAIGVVAIFIAYLTIAPLIALILCFLEQMLT